MSNREALLEAAVRCLQTRGYARTTARDLAREAGVNLGAIGYHYGSKQALLNEALEVSFRSWLEPAVAALRSSPSRSALQGITTLIAAIDLAGQHPEMVAASHEALAESGHSEPVRATLAATYERVRGEGAHHLSELGTPLTPEQTRTLSSLLIAIHDGLLIQRRLAPEDAPSTEHLQDLAQVLKALP